MAKWTEERQIPKFRRGTSGGKMKTIVVMLLASTLGKAKAEAIIEVAPELIANVSLLLAKYHTVDCLQIFRTDDLSLSRLESIFQIWKRLAVTETKVTTNVYSFRNYLLRKKKSTVKTSCYRSLKIMSDDDESAQGFVKFTKNFSFKDAVWVLFTDSLSLRFFENAHIMFDDVIIIAVIRTLDVVLFYEVYRVSQNLPLRVLSFGNWTKEGGFQVGSSDTFYDRRSDLEGTLVRIASVENWPAAYTYNGQWKGFLINIWKEMQRMVNCTTLTVESDAAHRSMGIKLQNGSWNGLAGMAVRNEIDLLINEVEIDKERSTILNFLHPITKSRLRIYTRHLGYKWQWGSVLKPFHVSVWAACIAWICIGAFFWTFTYRTCLSRCLELRDVENHFSPLKSLLFVTQALCQQGCTLTLNSYTTRILLFVSYAISSVLVPSYSASLVSSLAHKTELKTFESLKEMVNDGNYRLLVKENTSTHAFFAHAPDGIFRKVYEKLILTVPEKLKKLGLRDSLRAVCRYENLAVFGIEEIVEGRLQFIEYSHECPIIHLKQPVSTVYLSMATTKNNPYWGLLNHQLSKLITTGIVSRFKRMEFPPFEHSRLTDLEKGVSFGQLASAFLFITIFIIISGFMLLTERRHYFFKTFKEKRKRKKRHLYFDHCKGVQQYEMMCRKLKALPRVSY